MIGSIELMGSVKTRTNAFGAHFAEQSAKSLTMGAFVLNISSRFIPGLRGTPATQIIIWKMNLKKNQLKFF